MEKYTDPRMPSEATQPYRPPHLLQQLPPPHKHRKKPSRLRRAGLSLLVFGAACAGVGTALALNEDRAVPVFVAPVNEPLAASAGLAPVAPAGPNRALEEPVTSFGPGKWKVGIDIVPGRYRTSGPLNPSGPGCMYSLLKDGDGVIRKTNVPITVTIRGARSVFETGNCQNWRLVPK